MDRIIEMKAHPCAKDLLMSVSEDRGNPTLRLWDLHNGNLVKSVVLPPGGVSFEATRGSLSLFDILFPPSNKITDDDLSLIQVSSSTWSPNGSLLAIATKSKTLHVFDPRSIETSLTTCTTHDSNRPVRITWSSSSNNELLSTGFDRSATRELILYQLVMDPSASSVGEEKKKLSIVARTSLDVSPALLFPFVDLDTNIVLLYSRGDRSCHAFEITRGTGNGNSSSLTRLPSFENATLQQGWSFLPKQGNDVKKVEILKGLRLTPGTVESVVFNVPRAKVCSNFPNFDPFSSIFLFLFH